MDVEVFNIFGGLSYNGFSLVVYWVQENRIMGLGNGIQVTPAFNELRAKGFLKWFSYEKLGVDTGESIFCIFPKSHETDRDNAEERTLITDILNFTGAQHSVPYYQKIIRELGDHALTTIHHALSCAKIADRDGEIRTSRDQYFIGVLKSIITK